MYLLTGRVHLTYSAMAWSKYFNIILFFYIFSEELLQKALTNLRNTDGWLNLANYEVSLIVQDESMTQYLKDFKSMFNIIWWRNLRLGNWKLFMKALENHAQNSSYELYTGISGVAQYPTNDNCVKEKLLEMKASKYIIEFSYVKKKSIIYCL